MNVIDQLLACSVEERGQLLQEKYEKNLVFFQENYPHVYNFLLEGSQKYRIDLTESFLNIVEEETNEVCHPDRLDLFGQLLGEWTHENWIDFQNFYLPYPVEKYSIHREIIDRFCTTLRNVLPSFGARFETKRVYLQDVGGEKKSSPPVAFVGLFHGLHIDYFLSRTEPDSVLLIEPEIPRFEVSCYFIDYEAIQERFGQLYLVIGSDPDNVALRNFFVYGRVTPMVWLRVLPGYVSDAIGPFVSALRLLQQANRDMFTPIDIDFEALENGWKNLKSKLPLLTTQPKLSKESSIAVVAPGPSLKNDIKWLKKNKKNLIIIAVHGAVNPLKKEGIMPDFQCALEISQQSVIQELYNLDPEVPLIILYLADEGVRYGAKRVLMVGIHERYNIVKIHCPVPFTLPSTGSFAVAVAMMFNPANLFFIGLDLGYRDPENIHVKNSFYDGGDGKKYEKKALDTTESSLVAPNFTEQGPLWTKPFYTQARISIEAAIKYWNQKGRRKSKIYNFSDGSRIKGAEGIRSFLYGKVVNKSCHRDKKNILDAFKPAEKNLNWSPFERSGDGELAKFKKTILDSLQLDTFSFVEFAKVVDNVPLTSLIKSQETDPGNRMECYFRLVMDLMQSWYLFSLFCKDVEEGENVYREGKELIEQIILELQWPSAEKQ